VAIFGMSIIGIECGEETAYIKVTFSGGDANSIHEASRDARGAKSRCSEVFSILEPASPREAIEPASERPAQSVG
jgi:hypothetical protein